MVILPAFFGSSLKEPLPPEPVFCDAAVRPAPLTLTVTPAIAWLRASLVVIVTVLLVLCTMIDVFDATAILTGSLNDIGAENVPVFEPASLAARWERKS